MIAIIDKLATAIYHSRGLFALNRGDLERAGRLLRKGVRSGKKFPNPMLGETYLLLAATVAKCGRQSEAIDLFQLGMEEIQQRREYSLDDVHYIGSYFCQFLQLDEIESRCARFDITAVRKSLRRDFPMSLSKDGLIG
jgi:hypothetical protein